MDSMKRRTPKPPPVIKGGVRYQVLLGGMARGFGQNGGIVAAIDEANGKELWTVVVYPVRFDPAGDERDAQEVFITKLSLSPDGRELIVDNERQQRFLVHLADRSVTPAAK